MDDDLKVTEKTDLEKLLKIIQDLNYDLIGAQFENEWFLTRLDSYHMKHMDHMIWTIWYGPYDMDHIVCTI